MHLKLQSLLARRSMTILSIRRQKDDVDQSGGSW